MSLSKSLSVGPSFDEKTGSSAIIIAVLVLAAVAVLDLRLAVAAAAAVAAAMVVGTAVDQPIFALLAMVPAATLDAVGRLGSIGPLQLSVYQVSALLGVVSVALAVRRGRLKPASTPMDLPVLLFLAFVVTGVPVAIQLGTSMVASLSLISSAVMLFLTAWIVRDTSDVSKLMTVMAAVALVLASLALAERAHIFAIQGSYIQTWKDGIRARATYTDPNILGAFLAPASLFAASWAFAEKRLLVRSAFALSSLVSVAGIFVTLSRGALGGWFLGFVVLMLFVRMPAKVRLSVALALVVGLMAVFMATVNSHWVQKKIVHATEDSSAMTRVWMADAALQAFEDNPLGVGPGQYSLVYPAYRNASVRTKYVESHTAYLTVLVEIGILGFLAFCWMLWRFFSRVFLATRSASDGRVHALAVGALASGTALCAQAFTYSLEPSKILWFTFGLGMVAYRLSQPTPDASTVRGES